MKKLKTFSLRLRDTKSVETFTKFQKAVIFNKQPVQGHVLKMFDDYQKTNSPEFELVYESEIPRKAMADKIAVNSDTIKKYRRLGVLKDKSGNFYHTNSDNKIVYDWQKVRAFLKDRQKNPYAKLKK